MSLSTAGTTGNILAGKSEHHFLNRLLLKFGVLERNSKLLMNTLKVFLFAAIGKEAEMANLHEAAGKDM